MATFSFAVMAVLPLFLMIFVGYFLRLIHAFSEQFFNQLTRFCFRVGMPCLMFDNIYNGNLQAGAYLPMILFGVLGVSGLALLGFLIVPHAVKDPKKKGVMIQNLFRSNFFFFGIPMITNLFGKEHVGPAIMMVAFLVPAFNLLSAVILSCFQEHEGTKGLDLKAILKSIFTNPIILGAIVGFVFVLCRIPLFAFINQTVSDIADITTPIALISLGGTFQFLRAKHNRNYIVHGVIDKLFLVPALMLTLAVLLGFRGSQLATFLALFGAPGAVAGFIMAKEADADGELAGQLIVFTTAAAFISLVFFIFLLKTFAFM